MFLLKIFKTNKYLEGESRIYYITIVSKFLMIFCLFL